MTPHEQIESLRAEVAFLKQELGLTRTREQFMFVKSALGLSRRETDLVILLHRRGPNFVHKERIFEAVWGFDSDCDLKIVDVYICKLRKKLGTNAVRTLWGEGYQLSDTVRTIVTELLDKVPG